MAYRFCREAYNIGLEVYGEDHPRTKMYLSMLDEEVYLKYYDDKPLRKRTNSLFVLDDPDIKLEIFAEIEDESRPRKKQEFSTSP